MNMCTVEVITAFQQAHLPGPILEKLEPWIKFHKVEYKIVGGEDIPDDWIQGWKFRGRKGTKFTVVVITKLDSEQLHQVAEQLMECTDEQIEALE